jgi:hypothetical protein
MTRIGRIGTDFLDLIYLCLSVASVLIRVQFTSPTNSGHKVMALTTAEAAVWPKPHRDVWVMV